MQISTNAMYMHHLCLESHCDINVILVDGKRSSQCDRHQPSQSLISHLMIVDGKMVGSHRSIMYTEKKSRLRRSSWSAGNPSRVPSQWSPMPIAKRAAVPTRNHVAGT